jgi:hypothetical protein
MPHITTHKVTQVIGPLFGDPEIRECLTPRQCAQVDEILQKEELTRKDKRRLVEAIEDVLFHKQHDHDDEDSSA